jgi:predicted dehydrogenase
VQAWGYRHAHRRFEDVAYLRMFYEQAGVFANIHVSWLDPHKVRRVTAVGSQKMVVYNDMAEERIRIHDKGVAIGAESDVTQPPTSYRYGDVVSPFIPSAEPLAVQDAHFLTCLTTGAKPLTDGAAGLAVVDVLEAAELSLARSRPVFLDEVRERGNVIDLVSHQPVPSVPVRAGGQRLIGHAMNGSSAGLA